jgi:5,6-dimethylbenzimidazole synthase
VSWGHRPRANSPVPVGDFYDVLERRRDVRGEFNGKPVDDVVLHKILDAANCAPSVGLSQPWDFVLIDDIDIRTQFHQHVTNERDVFRAELPPERRATFDKIKIEGIRESSLGIVVTHDQSRGGDYVLGRHAIAETGLYSTCLAIQNLWLAATAEGLGVGWVSFYREEFLRELLGIPAHVRPIGWLCVGHVTHLETVPDLERFGWRKRRPVEDAIHHNRWAG